jgi:uncharacterized membrane protein YozB (DUF420 family)
VAALLFAKVLLAILYQYQWYFPADFDSDFLSVRREIFHGAYRIAFYAHIISAPIALVASLFLIVSGQNGRFLNAHRWVGRFLAGVAFGFVVPSGFVMACHAHSGPIAGAGLAALSVGTAISLIMAIRYARQRRFRLHQRWATRCFILLCSPLLLRVISGFVIVTRLDPDVSDRLNPWVSWLFPVVGYEIWWRYLAINHSTAISNSTMETRS